MIDLKDLAKGSTTILSFCEDLRRVKWKTKFLREICIEEAQAQVFRSFHIAVTGRLLSKASSRNKVNWNETKSLASELFNQRHVRGTSAIQRQRQLNFFNLISHLSSASSFWLLVPSCLISLRALKQKKNSH